MASVAHHLIFLFALQKTLYLHVGGEQRRRQELEMAGATFQLLALPPVLISPSHASV